MVSNNKYNFRPSASVIITTPSKLRDTFDYEVLLFKRSISTAFFPDHCVFPGGSFDENSDETLEWMQYYKQSGITDDQLALLTPIEQPAQKRPQLLLTNNTSISRDFSLRITAIRETFEEVGVLLCQSTQYIQNCVLNNHYSCYIEHFDKKFWQKEIHNNSKKFLELCRYLNVLPDLWSLHEWSVWRSPSTAYKKFDTVFYFVALENKPSLLPEETEVLMTMWVNPITSLSFFKNRLIWLPPLQFYEISRLKNIFKLTDLISFAIKRSKKGSTLMVMAYYNTIDDYRIGTLIGDDHFPEDPLFSRVSIPISISLQDFEKASKHLHRILYSDMYNYKIQMNIPSIDDHLTPMQENIFQSKL